MWERVQKLLRSVRPGSVILIILGAVLLLSPDSGSRVITLTLGWLLVIAGGLSVAASLFSRMAFGYGTMGSGLAMLLVGVLIVSRPMMLASLFGVVVGAYLVFSGLGSLGDAGRLRSNGQKWGFGMLWGLLSVIVGVYLILSPMTSSRLVMMIAGGAMIACGVGRIATHAKLARFLDAQRNFDPRGSFEAFDSYDDGDDNIIDV